MSRKNHLANEKSPYLLQHVDNPVDWYPWGEEAFKKAALENKPIFLSIGYSTCHWCHVMEHESFENEAIAKILNDHFISIKVDREERPDIDNIYMSAVMSMTGQGGWPLSVFLTPDKKPFYGGTYFPPEPKWGSPGFSDLLQSIHTSWAEQKDRIVQSSNSITDILSERALPTKSDVQLDKGVLKRAYHQLASNFDSTHGGFGHAPKFPMGHSLSFILRYGHSSKDDEALKMVLTTLDKMNDGGMWDHLGGGFHRYSTDREWQVPHFEKMLYDQALLSRVYLEAFQITKDDKYAKTAREIFDYVLRDMQFGEGGFYSAEDADSLEPMEHMEMTPDPDYVAEKKEGSFYLWTETELNLLLGSEDAKIFNYHYGVRSDGNAKSDPHNEFSGKNIIYVENSIDETAKEFKKTPEEIEKVISAAKTKLVDIRSVRPKPHLDDKILVDWNGLMISSLAFGSDVLGEPKYKEAAVRAADFILNNLVTKEGRLLHRYRDKHAGILGTIEDYAFFVHGLIDLYQATFDSKYLKEALKLSDDMIRLFWDEKDGGFYFTATDSEVLIIKQKEIYDGAIPSGNSLALYNLIRLYHFTLDSKWSQKGEELISAFSQEISERPSAHSQFLWGIDFIFNPSFEIVIVSDGFEAVFQEMSKSVYGRFLPNKVLLWRPSKESDDVIFSLSSFIKTQEAKENQTTAYLCEDHKCKLPVNTAKELADLLP